MSAQLKAAYDDLVTYLGKDTKGLEKAKRLKDVANELRKKLAAAEEKLEQVEAVKAAARERADKAEVAIPELQLEVQRQAQQIGNLQQQLAASAEAAAVKEDVDAPPDSDAELPQIRAAVSLLVNNLPQHPPAVAVLTLDKRSVAVIDRDAITSGWSARSLQMLGAFVALTVAHDGSVAITGARQRYRGELVSRLGKNSNLVKRYARWIMVAAEQSYDLADGLADKALARVAADKAIHPAELSRLSQQVYGVRSNIAQSVEEETSECESQEVR